MEAFNRAERDWLSPPEPPDVAVYECCLCGEGICVGEEFLELCEGMVCPACLDAVTVREFAAAVWGSTTNTAYTD
ncbi:hypothetical protein [uncultured Phascolarctobacterium sp.]|uniref:hypothetical protein n=1 Tax=uncultured Phascolarctobacterium sp. TaxID=512296 RepID=UPI0025CC35E7|nr:hypothetical protein [uncultured Phascolarctobacterium sp.]